MFFPPPAFRSEFPDVHFPGPVPLIVGDLIAAVGRHAGVGGKDFHGSKGLRNVATRKKRGARWPSENGPVEIVDLAMKNGDVP